MNVLVASGGTVAPIDDVRHVANASTGRLGAMLVEAALGRGHDVWHVRTPSALRPFDRSARLDLDAADLDAEFARLRALRDRHRAAVGRLHDLPLAVGTVPEYAERLERALRERPIDLILLPIAASDYAPQPRVGKIPSDRKTIKIGFRRLPKVIRSVRDWSPRSYLVGFKLLSDVPHDELIRQARAACLANRADLTVANDLTTVRAGRHALHVVDPAGSVESIGPGEGMAGALIDRAVAGVQAGRLSAGGAGDWGGST